MPKNSRPAESLKISGRDIQATFLDHFGVYRRTRAIASAPHSFEGCELLYLEKGKATWKLDGKDLLKLKGGDLAMVQPHVEHQGLDNIVGPCRLYILVFSNPKRGVSCLSPLTARELRSLWGKYQAFGNKVVRAGTDTAALIKRMEQVSVQLQHAPKDMLLPPLLRSLAATVMLSAVQDLSGSRATSENREIESLKTYIADHLDEKITLGRLSRVSGFSQSKLEDAFVESTGQSVAEYINRQRIHAAAERLDSTRKSITQIAFEFGFSTSQYFAVCFKKYMGLTPSAYRRQSNARTRS